MDLHDFDSTDLYFDEPCPPHIEAQLSAAAEGYGSGEAELALLRAYFLAPEQLSVLVGLYRFYFYQHRLVEADRVAIRAMAIAGARLGLSEEWSELTPAGLGAGIRRSMGLTRFWLMALKARAILALRDFRIETARAMLLKLREVDECDRLGVIPLLAVLEAVDAPGHGEAMAA